ncbi:MAG: IS200/IS605 family transposase [bacterium]|nr:IS200/IS605 family transposase [bacterium]
MINLNDMINLPSILIHVVFSTKHQEPLITEEIRDLLYSFLSGVLEDIDCIVVDIGGTPDHIHLLTSLNVNISLDDYIETVKARSADWVNDRLDLDVPFAWQESYAAFSVGRWSADELRERIRNQAEIHRHKSFQEEFIELLEENGADDYDVDELWD